MHLKGARAGKPTRDLLLKVNDGQMSTYVKNVQNVAQPVFRQN
jgi:hypothetical protein